MTGMVSPACARSDFRAGLYPLAAVLRVVADRLAGPAVSGNKKGNKATANQSPLRLCL